MVSVGSFRVELRNCKGKKIQMGVKYRPPNSSKEVVYTNYKGR